MNIIERLWLAILISLAFIGGTLGRSLPNHIAERLGYTFFAMIIITIFYVFLFKFKNPK